MPLCIRVKFLLNMYSGHSGTESSWPPSPARLISAIVAEAHRSGQERVLLLLQSLCRLPNPSIVAPQVFSSGVGASYMQAPVPTPVGELSRANAKERLKNDRSGTAHKSVNGHYSVDGDLFFLWEDVDLCEADHEALAETLREIPYLGRECDLAILSMVSENIGTLLDAHRSTHTVFLPTPYGGTRLRGLSPGLLSWLDDRHQSLFGEDTGNAIPVDHRIRIARYGAVTSLSSTTHLYVLPFSDVVSIDDALRRATLVDAGEGGFVFPLVRAGHPRLDGLAVGLGVVADHGVRVLEGFDYAWYGEDTGRASLQGGYWRREAREWMSVVPFIGHPDRWVAERQIEAAIPNATVTEMSARPVRPSQSFMASDDSHRAWHVTLCTENAVPGPLVLQKATGTAVFLPDYGKDGGQ